MIIYKILSLIGFLYTFVSIIYTINYYFKNRLRKKNYSNAPNYLPRRSKHKKNIIHRTLYILNSAENKNFIIYVPSISAIPWEDLIDNLVFGALLNILISVVFITGIAKFLKTYPYNSFIDNSMQYVMNFLILSTYVLVLVQSILDSKINVKLLLLVTLLIIYFSFVFVNSVIIYFRNFAFLFSNFIFFMLLNISAIGLMFGYVYFKSNNIFNYYTAGEFALMNSKDINNEYIFYYIIVTINKGLKPFYNFSSLSMNVNLFKEYGYVVVLPFFEYVIGVVFSFCIISFIVSGLVTRTVKPSKGY